MIGRSLLPLLAFVIPSAFGQVGLYGPVTTHLKAGDLAPGIQFSRVLSAAGGAQWSSSNLTGQLTVLVFYLNTSQNLQTITMWNSLVDSFADKKVQFLFISGEEASTLLPWLGQHPIKGWVFHDPDGQTGKAYGLEEPATTFIGADGRIMGFGTMGFPPDARLVNAALEGRITTTRPTAATLKTFMASGQTLLHAEPQRMPRAGENKPKFPPSYTVHVTPSHTEGHSDSSGDDFWSLQGYTLKEAICQLYDVNPIRVHLPASLDDGRRYDFALVLPEHEGRESQRDRLKQGLQDYFHLAVKREDRLVDTYVITSVSGHKPPAIETQTREGMGGYATSSGVEFDRRGGLDEAFQENKPASIRSIRGIDIDGTADEFCHTLEAELDLPVVNETRLEGAFAFHVESSQGRRNDFPEHLRDQAGLVITPGQRHVETLVLSLHGS